MVDKNVITIRHSAAHVMATAVQNLYEDVKFDIGPATDDGFYYDFDMEHRLSDADLKKIEKEMKNIIFKKRYPKQKAKQQQTNKVSAADAPCCPAHKYKQP